MRGDDVNKEDEKILDEIMGERALGEETTDEEYARLKEMTANSKKDRGKLTDEYFKDVEGDGE